MTTEKDRLLRLGESKESGLEQSATADYFPVPERAGISQSGRGTGVLVRLQADDLAVLDALCATSGKTRPEVLRLGLTALTIGADHG